MIPLGKIERLLVMTNKSMIPSSSAQRLALELTIIVWGRISSASRAEWPPYRTIRYNLLTGAMKACNKDIHWRGVKFRGSALLRFSASHHRKTTRFRGESLQSRSKISAMPRNKMSDDLDHVRKDPKPTTTPKGRPPDPWPLPTYVPLRISSPRTYGQGCLPSTVAPDDPVAIFDLFFNDEAIQVLVNHTNEYAFLNPGPESLRSRAWYPTTVKEFRAYLGVCIWIGLHIQSTIGEFWNIDALKGPIHDQILKYISLKRWQQIDRFFHISKPHPPGHKHETLFEKLEPLNNTLRQAFKKYWKPGTHLAVDETI